LAGERVRAAVVSRRRDFLEAVTIEVLQPSPQRVAPKCPVYDSCGGCDFMHLGYPDQAQAKAAWAAQALSRLKPDLPLKVSPSPSPWAYRHRVRFQVQNGRLGFFRKKSKEMVDITACPVACAAINRLLPGRSA
jgi:23S rRNA (uracil1939-C5)-methyltransferase